jgi:hypothetical protein
MWGGPVDPPTNPIPGGHRGGWESRRGQGIPDERPQGKRIFASNPSESVGDSVRLSCLSELGRRAGQPDLRGTSGFNLTHGESKS